MIDKKQLLLLVMLLYHIVNISYRSAAYQFMNTRGSFSNLYQVTLNFGTCSIILVLTTLQNLYDLVMALKKCAGDFESTFLSG